MTRDDTEGWEAYERPLDPEQHPVGKAHTQSIASTPGKQRTRIKRLVRCTLGFSKTERLHDLVLGPFVNRDECG